MRRPAILVTSLAIVITGAVFWFEPGNEALAGGGGPTRHPITVYEFSRGVVACGPKHQIRLRFTYDGAVLFDRTLNDGDKLPDMTSAQDFEAGRTLTAEVFVIVKATGAVKASGRWAGSVDFNGSTGWSFVSGPWADRPYFKWICRQAQELYGKWYLGFEGEQRPPE